MPKPEKIKSSGVSYAIDGIVAKRVQNLGFSGDIPVEEIQELANTGIVEYVVDAPTISVTMDTNEVGSVDILSLITDQLIDYDIVVGTDEPRGGIYRHFIKTDSANSRTITEQNMLSGYCSLSATLDEEGTAAARTMYINHAALTGFSYTYDVNGNAAENYTLTADNKCWYFNGWGNARVYKALFSQCSAQSTSNGATFLNLDSCVPDGSSVLAIGINGTILRTRGSGLTGNVTFSAVASGTFTATSDVNPIDAPWFSTVSNSIDRVWIVYRDDGQLWEASADPSDPGWELESASDAIGALRRGNIKAYLWNSGTDSEGTYTAAGRALRLQTVTIEGSLGEDPLFELGKDGFYAISKQTPVPITVTISTLDSDLEYFAALQSTAAANTDVKQLDVESFNGTNELRLEIYKEKTQATLLKTITVSNMRVSSENWNVAVGDNATQEISFTADNVTIAGSGEDVTGGWYTTG